MKIMRLAVVRRVFLAVSLMGAMLAAVPASAKVTITFWSRDMGGSSFPHAFVTLVGTLDADGAPVDTSFGFTAKAVTPAILLGSVAGRIDVTARDYIARSDAHFSAEISDEQYGAVLKLVDEWGENGDHHYNLNKRNCVHFVAEAARRAGLAVVEDPALMKKPHSFVVSLEPLNTGHVRLIEQPASVYLAERVKGKPADVPTAVADLQLQGAAPR